jgi:uncharacterized membrane protein YeaQ/YmgE (transglycosylase-associated protein family)
MNLVSLIVSLIAGVLAILLYTRAGESVSVFILVILGMVYPNIGDVVSPCIILYFCMRQLLL